MIRLLNNNIYIFFNFLNKILIRKMVFNYNKETLKYILKKMFLTKRKTAY